MRTMSSNAADALGSPVRNIVVILIFVAVVCFVTVTMLGSPESQRNALYGLGILALGVPVYLASARRGGARG